MEKGLLYLIPAPLHDSRDLEDITPANLKIIAGLKHFIVEELRTARRFLTRAGHKGHIDELSFLVYNEHSAGESPEEFLRPALEGHSIGLMSEAGLPCIADPGSLIVKTAHRMKIRVVPLSGPSSIFLALMASGFNGQNFAFNGYLPVEKTALSKTIRDLEARMVKFDQTQIFIETPYRNKKILETILEVCQPGTLVCIASEITGPGERITVGSVAMLQKNPPDIQKQTAVFLIYHE